MKPRTTGTQFLTIEHTRWRYGDPVKLASSSSPTKCSFLSLVWAKWKKCGQNFKRHLLFHQPPETSGVLEFWKEREVSCCDFFKLLEGGACIAAEVDRVKWTSLFHGVEFFKGVPLACSIQSSKWTKNGLPVKKCNAKWIFLCHESKYLSSEVWLGGTNLGQHSHLWD